MKALCAPTRAQEIADNLETALAQFKAIATKLSLQCIAPERGRGALIRSGSRVPTARPSPDTTDLRTILSITILL